jgi:hypothetical protein
VQIEAQEQTYTVDQSATSQNGLRAYLMISAPKIAIIIYRTATIPTSTMSGTFDPFKPKSINGDHYFHVSNNSTSE